MLGKVAEILTVVGNIADAVKHLPLLISLSFVMDIIILGFVIAIFFKMKK